MNEAHPHQAHTTAELAERMYPSARPAMAPLPQPPAPPPPAATPEATSPAPAAETPAAGGDQATAESDAVDPDMAALRSDLGYRMYEASEAARVLPDGALDRVVGQPVHVGGEQLQLDADAAQRGLVGLREMAADLGLSTNDIETVTAAFAIGESLRADPAKAVEAREQAVQMLNTQYGNEAALAMRCAHAFVAKNPKLATLLERTGAGDSPQAISLIARRALALHKAGKLTVPGANRQPQLSAAQRFYASSGMRP